jgi:hypothetical protein
MSDQDKRRLFSGRGEQRVKFFDAACHGTRHRTRIAPAVARAIVSADTPIGAEPFLHSRPLERKSAESGLKDRDRMSAAAAIDVHGVSVYGDYFAGKDFEYGHLVLSVWARGKENQYEQRNGGTAPVHACRGAACGPSATTATGVVISAAN